MSTTLSPEAVLKGRNAAFDRAIQAATGRAWSYDRQLMTVTHCPRCGGWMDWIERHRFWLHRSLICGRRQP